MIYDNESISIKTEHIIRNSLDSLSGVHNFEFCLVNMLDMESRMREKDLNLLSVLSEKELEYFYSLKIKKNKVQWLSGRYAVKSALFKYEMAGSNLLNPSYIDVLKGENSAPYISQYPNLCASITHSFPYCIGVVSKNKIGIDIEKVTEPNPSLIEHFYSREEKQALKFFTESDEYSKKCMTFWTRKEAASKFVKLGMKLDFRGLDTSMEKISLNNCHIQLKSIVCNDICISIALE